MTNESRGKRLAPVLAAAAWLATEKNPPHPLVPKLRERFGLSAAEACAAIREGNLMKARAH